MIGLLGKKVGMTQIFDEQGRQVPVTVLQVGPCQVTSIRTADKNGYSAVQLGFDEVKPKRLNKAKQGFLKKEKLANLNFIREIRTNEVDGLQVGQNLTVENFQAGDFVDVVGTSIGKGFQGVVKRHHFKGGASKSHGSMFGRVPGSIGASSFPSRVVKGMRAAGRMGHTRITVQSLKVVKVESDQNLLVLKGSVPGVEGGYLLVRTAEKRKGAARKWKVQGSQAASAKETSAPAGETAEKQESQ